MALPGLSAIPPGVFGMSIGAVQQLCVTTAVGAATVLSGAIEPSSINALAKVVYNLFLPSFLFCSVIKTVTAYGLSPQFAVMPLVAASQIAIGLLTTRFLICPLLGIDPNSDRGREYAVCTSFGNPGVLPLLFFDALFRSPYPDPSVMPQLAAFISFYLMGFTPLFWSVGKAVLTGGGGGDDGGSESGKGGERSWIKKAGGALAGALSPPPVQA